MFVNFLQQNISPYPLSGTLFILRRTTFPNRTPASLTLYLSLFGPKFRAALRTLFQGEQNAVEHD